jgi:hypothetical protein
MNSSIDTSFGDAISGQLCTGCGCGCALKRTTRVDDNTNLIFFEEGAKVSGTGDIHSRSHRWKTHHAGVLVIESRGKRIRYQ